MTGLSPLAPGAYADQVLVEASLTFPVPNGLAVDMAAMWGRLERGGARKEVRRCEDTTRILGDSARTRTPAAS